MTANINAPQAPAPSLEDSARRILRIIRPPFGSFPEKCVYLSFAFLFIQPQYYLDPIGTARLPLLVALLSGLVVLPRLKSALTGPTLVMFIFLAAEAARAFIGKAIIEDLVRNDARSFYTVTDLFLQYFGVMFPVAAFMRTGSTLRSLTKIWIFASLMLATHCILHAGFGPGGYLRDENDAGMVLLFFMSIPLALISEVRLSAAQKGRLLALLFILLIGVVATFSRGAFVGLMGVAAIFFLRSKRKFMMIAMGTALVLLALPLVPQKYLMEMGTISDTKESTADSRLYMWKIATRVWLDPAHFLIGVGPQNTSFHLADYETAIDTSDRPSIGGRAVHSIYFQLLPDLGCWGIMIVFLCVSKSLRMVGRNRARAAALSRRIPEVLALASQAADEGSKQIVRSALNAASDELDRLSAYAVAVNVMFTAVLTAGAFISVLYYPPLWMSCAMAVAVGSYGRDLLNYVEALVNTIQPPPPKPQAGGMRF